MKDLFLHVSNAITTKAPAVRWVDFDLGQLDGGQNPPVSLPCALVAFEEASYIRFGAGVRMAQQPFRVRLAFTVRERTHSKADPDFRPVALEHLDAVEAVKAALAGSVGTAFGPIELTGQSSESRADLRVYQLSFTCKVWEGADDEPVYKPVGDWPNAPATVEACVHPEVD